MIESKFRIILIALVLCKTALSQGLSVPVTASLAAVLPAKSYCSGQIGLACVMPNLYGPYGLVLPNSVYPARFNSSFQSTFSGLNEAIATQITLLPIASPASGLTYQFDPATGVFRRSAQTLGPVLTERAETIGRHKVFVGATFQRFRFNKIDGQPLHNWPAVFTRQVYGVANSSAQPFDTQFISTSNSLDLKVNQFTFFATYGMTDHVDISAAIPFLQIGMNAASYATINRTLNTEPVLINGVQQPCCSNGPPYANYFGPANPATSLRNTFSNNQYTPDFRRNPAKLNNLYSDPSKHDAAGLGDIVFRLKAGIYRDERTTLAVATDLRLPTGDEMNLLGTGAIGWKPFLALSVRSGPLTPHFNVGYQWNGSSILGGNAFVGTKANLPGFAFLSSGTDIGVTRKLTIAVDYIGQELINAPQATAGTFTSQAPLVSTGEIESFSSVEPIAKRTYNQSNLSIGLKANVVDQLVVSANFLVALNKGGLRQAVVPLIGISYTFK